MSGIKKPSKTAKNAELLEFFNKYATEGDKQLAKDQGLITEDGKIPHGKQQNFRVVVDNIFTGLQKREAAEAVREAAVELQKLAKIKAETASVMEKRRSQISKQEELPEIKPLPADIKENILATDAPEEQGASGGGLGGVDMGQRDTERIKAEREEASRTRSTTDPEFASESKPIFSKYARAGALSSQFQKRIDEMSDPRINRIGIRHFQNIVRDRNVVRTGRPIWRNPNPFMRL